MLEAGMQARAVCTVLAPGSASMHRPAPSLLRAAPAQPETSYSGTFLLQGEVRLGSRQHDYFPLEKISRILWLGRGQGVDKLTFAGTHPPSHGPLWLPASSPGRHQ